MNRPVLPAFVYKQYGKYVQPSLAGVGTELEGGGDRTINNNVPFIR